MSTYARINSLTKKVDNIIEADSYFIYPRSDYDLWIETSVALTKKIAAPGDTYDVVSNQFKSVSLHNSWVFNNSTWAWEAPTAMPEIIGDISYEWDEATTNWIEVTGK